MDQTQPGSGDDEQPRRAPEHDEPTEVIETHEAKTPPAAAWTAAGTVPPEAATAEPRAAAAEPEAAFAEPTAEPSEPVEPSRPRGPHAPTVLLGLICLLVAALAIASQSTDVTVDWSLLGPGTIVGAGAVLVLLGLVGLIRRER